MTSSFEIAPVTSASFGVIEALHGECFDEPWTDSDIAKVMAMPGAFGLVAMTSGAPDPQPVGFLLAWCIAGEGEILSIGVRPDLRRQGIGARLLSAALGHARSQEIRRVALEVAHDNAEAIGLYASQGFTIAGRRPKYYRDRAGEAIDAQIMTIELAQ